MDIIPLGHASFKFKGKSASVITDPFNPLIVGLPFPKHTAADIVTVSHDHEDHNYVKILDTSEVVPVIFKGPGEYEAKGIDICAVPTFHDDKEGAGRGKNTVFKIEIDGLRIVHLGDLGHLLLDLQLEIIDNVDIVCVPVGGIYTIDAKQASKIIADLEPKIVIPMHYLRSGLNPKAFSTLSTVDQFLKEMGKEATKSSKLKITKDSLPPEMQIVVLE